ncbi:hypothetical protein [Nocardia stercoris]|uniref:Large secreted protein n=1 Tax=Nocardia stercoris TaxID=2483361 RepID=A0A3M2L0Q3_9NOCA|nr:hypothetical protein [Nocardia stercoris]RMI28118.1 hypothetical protein EBN03_31535 [Nocardia stercoris]
MNALRGARRLAAAAATALAVLTVAACGHTGNAAPQKNSTTTTPAPPSSLAQPRPGRTFTADPAIVNPRPLRFDSWYKIADDKIAVNFQLGSPDCYGVDVETTETDSAVTVALRTGTLPQAVGRMCSMIAVFGSMEIDLQHPLGSRKVQ